ncbi:hypothetical protein OUZ56_001436 [Daphnia magna]|uniref:Uncharacterized protein n=1 Tax=Daphnia magna TaxID=35525 RepID=A0ABR0A2M0_9CRUS|nr:hypothetical protein OUZ56_001436 [Daphnia magna]
MGCVQSQSNGQTSKDKGAASVIGDNNGQGGASAAQVDPRLPLNARQKYSMLASWKGISRALEPTGVYMFIKITKRLAFGYNVRAFSQEDSKCTQI